MKSIKLTSAFNESAELRVVKNCKEYIEILAIIPEHTLYKYRDAIKTVPVTEVSVRISQEEFKELKKIMTLQFSRGRKALSQNEVQSRLQSVLYSFNLGEFRKPVYLDIRSEGTTEYGILGEYLNNVEIQFKKHRDARSIRTGWALSISKAEWQSLIFLIENKPFTAAFKSKYVFTPFGHVLDFTEIEKKYSNRAAYHLYKDMASEGDTLVAVHTSYEQPREVSVHAIDAKQELIWLIWEHGFFAQNKIPSSVAVFNKKFLSGVELSIRKEEKETDDYCFTRIFVKGCDKETLKNALINKGFSDWNYFISE